MPIVRTAVKSGTSPEIKEKIVMGIHSALVEGIGMPQDELFNLVQSYDPADFFYSRTFNGIARSDDVVVVEITIRRGRSDAMKTALNVEGKQTHSTSEQKGRRHVSSSAINRDVFCDSSVPSCTMYKC